MSMAQVSWGDTGFFRDSVKQAIVFVRDGKPVAELLFTTLETDPYAVFNRWRRGLERKPNGHSQGN
jgi:hypothetical protein